MIVTSILVVFYFLFVTFFFDPFEKRLDDMAAIVPREVEYFFRWKGAGESFDEFPVPKLWGDFESSQIHDRLDKTGALDEWGREMGVAQVVTNLRKVSASLPMGLNFEKDILQEVALSGRGLPNLNANFDGMVMLRVSFKVKAGVAMLGLDTVREKLPQSLQIQSLDNDVYRLPQFSAFGYQDAYLKRIQDVLVLASRPEWLETAHSLQLQSGQDSLAEASIFRDQVEAYLAPGDQPIEVFLRWEKMRDTLGRWPSPAGTGLVNRIGRSMFDTDLLRYAAGYLHGGDAFELRLGGATDLSTATPSQRSFLQSPPMSSSRMRKYAGMVPADSFLFTCLGGDPGKILLEASSVLDADFRTLLNETIGGTSQYQGLMHLLEDIGRAAAPGVAIAFHADNYPADAQRDVEHDNAPMPLYAVFIKIKDRGAYDRVMEFFQQHWKRFTGGDGRDRLTAVDLHGGTRGISFASPLIPGTGEVMVAEIKALDTLVVSNSFKYAHRIVESAFVDARERDAKLKKLSLDDTFQSALSSHKNGSSVFFWFDPQKAEHWFQQSAKGVAQEAFRREMSQVWARDRPAETSRQREKLFGNRENLSSSEESSLIQVVDEALANKYRQEESQRVPALLDEALADFVPIQALEWLSLGFRPHRREVSIVVNGELSF